MKTFIIVVETAIIAFVFGGAVGMELQQRKDQQAEEASKEETPA